MKTALILGGTKGLGFELARVLYEEGGKSTIFGSSSLDEDALDILPNAEFKSIDLSDNQSVDQISLELPPVQYFIWVAGVFLKNKVIDTADEVIDHMINVHLRGPIKFIKKFLRNQKQTPFHLITIASCSSWRLREDEAIYCGLKAAQATFTRNISVELSRDIPGTKVTLINPGGLQTVNFWKDTEQNTSGFLDPNKVARIIWNITQNQTESFQEVQILRKKPVVVGSEPIVEFGPKVPEVLL